MSKSLDGLWFVVVLCALVVAMLLSIVLIIQPDTPTFQDMQTFMTDCQEGTQYSFEQCLELWKIQ